MEPPEQVVIGVAPTLPFVELADALGVQLDVGELPIERDVDRDVGRI